MRTTIDAAGRVVIPKRIRDDFGLDAGRDLEVTVVDGTVQIEPVPTTMHLERRGKGLVAYPAERLPVLTADEVRAALERIRR